MLIIILAHPQDQLDRARVSRNPFKWDSINKNMPAFHSVNSVATTVRQLRNGCGNLLDKLADLCELAACPVFSELLAVSQVRRMNIHYMI